MHNSINFKTKKKKKKSKIYVLWSNFLHQKKGKYSKLKSSLNFFKPKNVSPSGLIIMFGNRGKGKSTDIAKRYHKLYKLRKKGKCPYKYFYTNLKMYNVDPEFYRYLDLNNFDFINYLGDIMSDYGCICDRKFTPYRIEKNSYICIDELGLIFHNREYKTFPKEFTKFVKLIRKFGIYMVGYSQAFDIDKAIRTSSNELYLMNRIGHITFSRLIKKYIGVNEKDENGNSDSQIADKVKFSSIFEKGSILLTYIPFYTDYFNSFD